MLENYCCFRKAMVILNMIRQGVFGELLHCEGRSQENWRLFNSDGTMGWTAEHLAKRNGNLLFSSKRTQLCPVSMESVNP